MKSAIEIFYKGVKEYKAGSCIINGKTIKYDAGHKIIFDQLINGVPKETELKVPKDIALNLLPNFKPYDKLVLNLDITIYGNYNVSIKIVSIEKK